MEYEIADRPNSKQQFDSNNSQNADYLNDYIIPEQRLDAIIDILASITKRIINKHHDNNSLQG
jgi:hypothetical protein